MTNESAFPLTINEPGIESIHAGFTKLEYVSAMCLQGMLSNSVAGVSLDMADTYAKKSVLLAKHLITELEKEKK